MPDTTPSPIFAVLAVSMRDQSRGTVVSLHIRHDEAVWARHAYRANAGRPRPDLYVIGKVPPGTQPGNVIPLQGGGVAPETEEERAQK